MEWIKLILIALVASCCVAVVFIGVIGMAIDIKNILTKRKDNEK